MKNARDLSCYKENSNCTCVVTACVVIVWMIDMQSFTYDSSQVENLHETILFT